MRIGKEFLDETARGFGAEHHGFRMSTGAEEAIGECMSALAIRRELDFVDREKIYLTLQWHRLDCAYEVSRGLGQHLFFAGDERYRAAALYPDDPVIDLAREKPERLQQGGR